jgi:hypothetical protein
MAAVQAASASAAALTTKRCHIAVSSAPATTSGPQPCASLAREAKSIRYHRAVAAGKFRNAAGVEIALTGSPTWWEPTTCATGTSAIDTPLVVRQEQVAMRLAFAGHAGAHADRPDLLRMRMPRTIHPAMAEPGQARAAISAADYHRIAYCEVLDRDLA